MAIRVNNIVLDINDCAKDNIDAVKIKAAKIMRVDFSEIKNCRIAKESIDARKKNNIKFNYAVSIEMDNEEKVVEKANHKDVKLEEVKYDAEFEFGSCEMESIDL